MATQRWLKLALGTGIVIAALSSIGLFNTWRWHQGLLWGTMASPLPRSFWVSAVLLAGQLVASLIVLLGAAWGTPVGGRWRVCFGLGLLLALQLVDWAQRLLAASAGLPVTAHLTRSLIALWLAFLMFRLAPNNSSKPTPLRGAA